MRAEGGTNNSRDGARQRRWMLSGVLSSGAAAVTARGQFVGAAAGGGLASRWKGQMDRAASTAVCAEGFERSTRRLRCTVPSKLHGGASSRHDRRSGLPPTPCPPYGWNLGRGCRLLSVSSAAATTRTFTVKRERCSYWRRCSGVPTTDPLAAAALQKVAVVTMMTTQTVCLATRVGGGGTSTHTRVAAGWAIERVGMEEDDSFLRELAGGAAVLGRPCHMLGGSILNPNHHPLTYPTPFPTPQDHVPVHIHCGAAARGRSGGCS